MDTQKIFSLYISFFYLNLILRKRLFYTFVFIVFEARMRDLTKPFSNSMYRFDYGIASTLIHCFLLPNAISSFLCIYHFSLVFNPVNLFSRSLFSLTHLIAL